MNFKNGKSFIPPLWILTLALLTFVFWIAYRLKEMVVLLVVSFSIAYVISPALDFLERRNIPRPIGFALVALVIISVFITAFFTAIPTLVREYNTLTANFPNYMDSLKNKGEPIVLQLLPYLPEEWRVAITTGSLTSILSLDQNLPLKITRGLWTTLLTGYNYTLALVNAALLPFLVYYLSVDYRRLYEGLLDWFPIIRRGKISRIFEEVDNQVSSYVRGQLLVGFVLFILFAIGLGILQIELWFLVAFISGFGNLIPYVGTVIGVLLATLMAVVTYGDFSSVLLVWALYAGVQLIEGTFITPKIIGDSIGLSPLMVILALLAGGSLFGLLGVFLAVPVLAALKVLTKHLHSWAIHQVGV